MSDKNDRHKFCRKGSHCGCLYATQPIHKPTSEGELIERYKIALSDAIRRPMGVFPASSEGLITEDEVNDAEVRRITTKKR